MPSKSPKLPRSINSNFSSTMPIKMAPANHRPHCPPVSYTHLDVYKRQALYTGLFRELLTYMMEDPRAITPCTHLLFMAKNLERIGDHATNIAENVWFLLHGDTPLPPRNKRDGSLMPAV